VKPNAFTSAIVFDYELKREYQNSLREREPR
jgi:hypothetical protein